MPVFALALLLPLPGDPTVPGTVFPADAQWAAVTACPKITIPREASGTGVVVGVKGGFAYLLTAAHVAKYDGLFVEFTTRAAFPKAAWSAESPEVLARWPDPDLALIRFPLGDKKVPAVPLAGAGQRPKRFPVTVWAVGVGGGEAAVVRVDQLRAKKYIRRPDHEGAFFWETDHPPDLGRSGGPLLDERGRVIGLCTARMGNNGYYTHLDEIQAALTRGGYGWLVPPP